MSEAPRSPIGGLNPNNEISRSQHHPVGARLQLFWKAWNYHLVDPWVITVLREGYRVPFHHPPPLSLIPMDFPSYSGNKEKFLALQAEVAEMLQKNAIEEVPGTDPGFYNRLFLVLKASGSWRPVLDVSRLNAFVVKTKFSMETSQSVLDAIQQGDWMISMDMKDAYFHIPIHPASRPYLRFTFGTKVYQFRALCFGLTTAPQVFTRVLAPLAKIVHLAGFKIILYLDDWLVIASSREEVLRAKKFVLDLALELGILINMEKSHLEPTQVIEYLGMSIDSNHFWVSPTQKRVSNASKIIEEFLCSKEKPAKTWQSLLGHMSSLEKFVTGSRLRIRPLQYHFNRIWDRKSQRALLPIPADLTQDLLWWSDQNRLSRGIPLHKSNPDLQLFSDASREGWGATVGTRHLAGKWSPSEKKDHINILELRAIWMALKEVQGLVRGKTIAVFSDNTTALAYLQKQGGTRSWTLYRLVREMFMWLEANQICLIPQLICGSKNVVTDMLSRKGQILSTELVLHQDVGQRLWKLWGQPMIDLFATSLTKRLPLYVAPHADLSQ